MANRSEHQSISRIIKFIFKSRYFSSYLKLILFEFFSFIIFIKNSFIDNYSFAKNAKRYDKFGYQSILWKQTL